MALYKGEVGCGATYKTGARAGEPCVKKAYYLQDGEPRCGVHSKKDTRAELPVNPRAAEIRAEAAAAHKESWKKAAAANREAGRQGEVACAKLKMYAKAPHRDGYLSVFPNFKHQNRSDGFGCAALSPKSLGPVEHGQPGLPSAKNLENFHQGSKCFESELVEGPDGRKVPGPEFYATQLAMFEDETPHRHKAVAKKVKGNKNVCAFWVWVDPATGVRKRFSYGECRQFYCNYYERLARQQPDLRKLLVLKVKRGVNLLIIGYDGYDVTPPEGKTLPEHLMTCYEDTSRPFGHELVLFTMLTCKPENYPWRIGKTEKF